jgi:hypothetical protein
MAKAERRAIDKTLIFLGLVTAVFMLIFGGLAWYGYHFATTTVHDELASQKIYFPPKGSPALDPAEFPSLQKYAGQLVDNGPKAKAYANEFIGKHLQAVADGQTYSEVSSQSLKDPSNQKLQAQKAVLFQGETLRGLLLGDGYAYWTFGMLSKYVAITAFAGAGVMAILVWLGAMHLSRLR